MYRKILQRQHWLGPLVMAAVLSLCACSQNDEIWWEGIHDLSGVRISEDLAPTLAVAVRSLQDSPSHGWAVADLEKYQELVIRLKSPGEIEAAGDEVYRLWRADPTHVLWLDLAKNNNRYLRRTDDMNQMLTLPVLSDTTTAIGAYVLGRLRYMQTDRGQMYRLAESRIAELDTLQQVWLNIKLTGVDFSSGDPTGAVRRLLRWIPAARAVGGPILESVMWRNVASRLTAMDRLDDALQAAVMAGAKARQAGSTYRYLRAEDQIARIRDARLEHAGALELVNSTLRSAEAEGFHWLVQSGLGLAAQLNSVLGDYDQALALDRRNLALTVQRNDPLNLPRALSNIAHDHRMLGELDSCRIYLERASSHVNESSDRRNRSRMAQLLAEYHCLVGQYAVADSLLIVAAGLSETSGTERLEAHLLLELIPAAIEMGRADRAYAWLKRVRELEKAILDSGFDQNLRADYEIVSSRLMAYQGEYGRAAAALERAGREVIAGGGEGTQFELDYLTGELAWLRNDTATAQQAFGRCLEFAERAGNAEQISRCRFRLGVILLEEGAYAAARRLFAPFVEDDDFGPRFRTWLAGQLWLGITWARSGNHPAALESYRTALQSCSPYSPADLVARLQIEESRSLIATGESARAAESLRDLHVRLRTAPSGSGSEETEFFANDTLRATTELLVGLYLDHPELVKGDSVAGLTRELAWPCLANEPFDEQSVRGLTLGTYFVGEERSFLWVTQLESTTVYELPGQDELKRVLTPVVADMTTPGRTIDAEPLQAVSRILLSPLAGTWHRNSTLSLIPDGLLHGVPWGGLILPQEFEAAADDIALQQGPIVEYHVRGDQARRAPLQASPKRVDLALLALGCDEDAGAAKTGFRRLRRAEEEASRVAADWLGRSAVVKVGAEANWDRIAGMDLLGVDVLHLATHAQVYPGRPERSTLRLSTSEESDPVTIGAVAELDLNAELVFLSCCNAARRLSTYGGGASDFATAFLQAGARSVIASTLWVDDDVSAYLAERFYHHWLNGMSRAEALRTSLLEVREARQEWKHPSYWAFHRLIGDAN